MDNVQVELPRDHFNNVIRYLKNCSLDRVNNLRSATFAAMKRLGVQRDLDSAVKGVPNGSDQGDIRSIIVWMDKITKTDKKAIKQLVAIDATCVMRTEG